MFCDERVFFVRKHHHAGCVLGVQWLVLYGDGCDRYALSLHLLNILYKICGVGPIVFGFEMAILGTAVGLHPRWCRPWRCKYVDGWIDGKNLLEHRNDVGPVRA